MATHGAKRSSTCTVVPGPNLGARTIFESRHWVVARPEGSRMHINSPFSPMRRLCLDQN